MSILVQASHFTRWRDWGPGKVTLLCSLCFYIATAYRLSFGTFALTFVLFLLFASAQSAAGFVLNDWGDRDLDRKQGKPNVFNEWPYREGVVGLTVMLGVALATGLPFITRPAFALLWGVWMAAAAAYSLEPLRFKTRGLLGLAVSFTAQWSLPVFIAFAAFERLGGLDMWGLALALTVSGATLEIAHQRYDRWRDAGAQAHTFAVSLSTRIDHIYAIAVALDKLAIGLVVALVALSLTSLGSVWSLVLAGGVMAIYLALLALTLPAALRAIGGGTIQDPYYSEGRSAAQLLHQTLPNFVLPMTLAFAATLRMPQYGIVLVLFGIWRIILGGADWRWPMRMLGL
jgi:4-hydroxybenzoate polyprenyltransferase